MVGERRQWARDESETKKFPRSRALLEPGRWVRRLSLGGRGERVACVRRDNQQIRKIDADPECTSYVRMSKRLFLRCHDTGHFLCLCSAKVPTEESPIHRRSAVKVGHADKLTQRARASRDIFWSVTGANQRDPVSTTCSPLIVYWRQKMKQGFAERAVSGSLWFVVQHQLPPTSVPTQELVLEQIQDCRLTGSQTFSSLSNRNAN